MSVFNSFGKPMLVMVIIMLISGTLGGLAISNYDPWQNAANARRTDEETDYLNKVNDLSLDLRQKEFLAKMKEIERQQALLDANHEAQIGKIQSLNELEIQKQKELNTLEISKRKRQAQIKNILYLGFATVGGISILILTIALAYVIVRRINRPTQVTALYKNEINGTKLSDQAMPNLWENRSYQIQMRKIARQNELMARENRKNSGKHGEKWPMSQYPN